MYNTTYLVHHGIKGQRWGIRRYQNPDGTLTNAGRKHKNDIELVEENNKNSRVKKSLKIGAIVAGSILAVYGAAKVAEYTGINKEIKDYMMPKMLERANKSAALFTIKKNVEDAFNSEMKFQKRRMRNLVNEEFKYRTKERIDKFKRKMNPMSQLFTYKSHSPFEIHKMINERNR